MKPRIVALASLIAAGAILGGCAVSPTYETHYVETVRVAPPPPRIEYVGTPPVVGYVWISGYWNWGGSRYVWVPGRWEAPRHGHHWVPHRWERHGDGWRHYGGHWESDGHRHGPAHDGGYGRHEWRGDAHPGRHPERHSDRHVDRRDERPAPRPLAQTLWQAPQAQPAAVEVARPPGRDPSPEARRHGEREDWRHAGEKRPAREAGPLPQSQGGPIDRGAERRHHAPEARNDRPDHGGGRDAGEGGRQRERERERGRRNRDEGRQG